MVELEGLFLLLLVIIMKSYLLEYMTLTRKDNYIQ